MTHRRLWPAFGLPSKRFPTVLPLAGYRRALIAAVAAGALSTLVVGCDDRHDDANAQSEASTATLPGTRASVAPQAGARAQQFDMGAGAPEHAASDALLPPVMHTAD